LALRCFARFSGMRAFSKLLTGSLPNAMEVPKILVCEDERIVAGDIRKCLLSYGYQVTGVTASGEGALEMAEHARPDLVLMDIRLQGSMNGIEAAAKLKERFSVPVIYLTAFADGVTVDRAKATAPLGYLVKPFNDDDLHSAIEVGLIRQQQQKALEQEIDRYRKQLAKMMKDASVSDRILQLKQRLLEAEKLDAIRTLAGGVAHHVNNALCIIEGSLEYLRESGGAERSGEQRLMAAALDRCEKTAQMIRQLLWFSEQSAKSSEETSIPELLTEALEDASASFPAEIDAVTSLADKNLIAPVDPRQVRRVFTSVLENAVQAMPEGGVLTLSCGRTFEEVPEQFNPRGKPGWYVVATIKDSGHGISPQDMPHLYEPFFTTRAEEGGLGLGLSLVYGVMQSHGGWVGIESTPGKGTSVSLYFPQRSAAVKSEETQNRDRKTEIEESAAEAAP
jgi:signal transduction histidine kinase